MLQLKQADALTADLEASFSALTDTVRALTVPTVIKGIEDFGNGHWITIHKQGIGSTMTTHVFITEPSGTVVAGPKHLIGHNIGSLPPPPGYNFEHHAAGVTPEGHNSHPDYMEQHPHQTALDDAFAALGAEPGTGVKPSGENPFAVPQYTPGQHAQPPSSNAASSANPGEEDFAYESGGDDGKEHVTSPVKKPNGKLEAFISHPDEGEYILTLNKDLVDAGGDNPTGWEIQDLNGNVLVGKDDKLNFVAASHVAEYMANSAPTDYDLLADSVDQFMSHNKDVLSALNKEKSQAVSDLVNPGADHIIDEEDHDYEPGDDGDGMNEESSFKPVITPPSKVIGGGLVSHTNDAYGNTFTLTLPSHKITEGDNNPKGWIIQDNEGKILVGVSDNLNYTAASYVAQHAATVSTGDFDSLAEEIQDFMDGGSHHIANLNEHSSEAVDAALHLESGGEPDLDAFTQGEYPDDNVNAHLITGIPGYKGYTQKLEYFNDDNPEGENGADKEAILSYLGSNTLKPESAGWSVVSKTGHVIVPSSAGYTHEDAVQATMHFFKHGVPAMNAYINNTPKGKVKSAGDGIKINTTVLPNKHYYSKDAQDLMMTGSNGIEWNVFHNGQGKWMVFGADVTALHVPKQLQQPGAGNSIHFDPAHMSEGMAKAVAENLIKHGISNTNAAKAQKATDEFLLAQHTDSKPVKSIIVSEVPLSDPQSQMFHVTNGSGSPWKVYKNNHDKWFVLNHQNMNVFPDDSKPLFQDGGKPSSWSKQTAMAVAHYLTHKGLNADMGTSYLHSQQVKDVEAAAKDFFKSSVNDAPVTFMQQKLAAGMGSPTAIQYKAEGPKTSGWLIYHDPAHVNTFGHGQPAPWFVTDASGTNQFMSLEHHNGGKFTKPEAFALAEHLTKSGLSPHFDENSDEHKEVLKATDEFLNGFKGTAPKLSETHIASVAAPAPAAPSQVATNSAKENTPVTITTHDKNGKLVAVSSIHVGKGSLGAPTNYYAVAVHEPSSDLPTDGWKVTNAVGTTVQEGLSKSHAIELSHHLANLDHGSGIDEQSESESFTSSLKAQAAPEPISAPVDTSPKPTQLPVGSPVGAVSIGIKQGEAGGVKFTSEAFKVPSAASLAPDYHVVSNTTSATSYPPKAKASEKAWSVTTEDGVTLLPDVTLGQALWVAKMMAAKVKPLVDINHAVNTAKWFVKTYPQIFADAASKPEDDEPSEPADPASLATVNLVKHMTTVGTGYTDYTMQTTVHAGTTNSAFTVQATSTGPVTTAHPTDYHPHPESPIWLVYAPNTLTPLAPPGTLEQATAFAKYLAGSHAEPGNINGLISEWMKQHGKELSWPHVKTMSSGGDGTATYEVGIGSPLTVQSDASGGKAGKISAAANEPVAIIYGPNGQPASPIVPLGSAIELAQHAYLAGPPIEQLPAKILALINEMGIKTYDDVPATPQPPATSAIPLEDQTSTQVAFHGHTPTNIEQQAKEFVTQALIHDMKTNLGMSTADDLSHADTPLEQVLEIAHFIKGQPTSTGSIPSEIAKDAYEAIIAFFDSHPSFNSAFTIPYTSAAMNLFKYVNKYGYLPMAVNPVYHMIDENNPQSAEPTAEPHAPKEAAVINFSDTDLGSPTSATMPAAAAGHALKPFIEAAVDAHNKQASGSGVQFNNLPWLAGLQLDDLYKSIGQWYPGSSDLSALDKYNVVHAVIADALVEALKHGALPYDGVIAHYEHGLKGLYNYVTQNGEAVYSGGQHGTTLYDHLHTIGAFPSVTKHTDAPKPSTHVVDTSAFSKTVLPYLMQELDNLIGYDELEPVKKIFDQSTIGEQVYNAVLTHKNWASGITDADDWASAVTATADIFDPAITLAQIENNLPGLSLAYGMAFDKLHEMVGDDDGEIPTYAAYKKLLEKQLAKLTVGDTAAEAGTPLDNESAHGPLSSYTEGPQIAKTMAPYLMTEMQTEGIVKDMSALAKALKYEDPTLQVLDAVFKAGEWANDVETYSTYNEAMQAVAPAFLLAVNSAFTKGKITNQALATYNMAFKVLKQLLDAGEPFPMNYDFISMIYGDNTANQPPSKISSNLKDSELLSQVLPFIHTALLNNAKVKNDKSSVYDAVNIVQDSLWPAIANETSIPAVIHTLMSHAIKWHPDVDHLSAYHNDVENVSSALNEGVDEAIANGWISNEQAQPIKNAFDLFYDMSKANGHYPSEAEFSKAYAEDFSSEPQTLPTGDLISTLLPYLKSSMLNNAAKPHKAKADLVDSINNIFAPELAKCKSIPELIAALIVHGIEWHPAINGGSTVDDDLKQIEQIVAGAMDQAQLPEGDKVAVNTAFKAYHNMMGDMNSYVPVSSLTDEYDKLLAAKKPAGAKQDQTPTDVTAAKLQAVASALGAKMKAMPGMSVSKETALNALGLTGINQADTPEKQVVSLIQTIHLYHPDLDVDSSDEEDLQEAVKLFIGAMSPLMADGKLTQDEFTKYLWMFEKAKPYLADLMTGSLSPSAIADKISDPALTSPAPAGFGTSPLPTPEPPKEPEKPPVYTEESKLKNLVPNVADACAAVGIPNQGVHYLENSLSNYKMFVALTSLFKNIDTWHPVASQANSYTAVAEAFYDFIAALTESAVNAGYINEEEKNYLDNGAAAMMDYTKFNPGMTVSQEILKKLFNGESPELKLPHEGLDYGKTDAQITHEAVPLFIQKMDELLQEANGHQQLPLAGIEAFESATTPAELVAAMFVNAADWHPSSDDKTTLTQDAENVGSFIFSALGSIGPSISTIGNAMFGTMAAELAPLVESGLTDADYIQQKLAELCDNVKPTPSAVPMGAAAGGKVAGMDLSQALTPSLIAAIQAAALFYGHTPGHHIIATLAGDFKKELQSAANPSAQLSKVIGKINDVGNFGPYASKKDQLTLASKILHSAINSAVESGLILPEQASYWTDSLEALQDYVNANPYSDWPGPKDLKSLADSYALQQIYGEVGGQDNNLVNQQHAILKHACFTLGNALINVPSIWENKTYPVIGEATDKLAKFSHPVDMLYAMSSKPHEYNLDPNAKLAPAVKHLKNVIKSMPGGSDAIAQMFIDMAEEIDNAHEVTGGTPSAVDLLKHVSAPKKLTPPPGGVATENNGKLAAAFGPFLFAGLATYAFQNKTGGKYSPYGQSFSGDYFEPTGAKSPELQILQTVKNYMLWMSSQPGGSKVNVPLAIKELGGILTSSLKKAAAAGAITPQQMSRWQQTYLVVKNWNTKYQTLPTVSEIAQEVKNQTTAAAAIVLGTDAPKSPYAPGLGTGALAHGSTAQASPAPPPQAAAYTPVATTQPGEYKTVEILKSKLAGIMNAKSASSLWHQFQAKEKAKEITSTQFTSVAEFLAAYIRSVPMWHDDWHGGKWGHAAQLARKDINQMLDSALTDGSITQADADHARKMNLALFNYANANATVKGSAMAAYAATPEGMAPWHDLPPHISPIVIPPAKQLIQGGIPANGPETKLISSIAAGIGNAPTPDSALAQYKKVASIVITPDIHPAAWKASVDLNPDYEGKGSLPQTVCTPAFKANISARVIAKGITPAEFNHFSNKMYDYGHHGNNGGSIIAKFASSWGGSSHSSQCLPIHALCDELFGYSILQGSNYIANGHYASYYNAGYQMLQDPIVKKVFTAVVLATYEYNQQMFANKGITHVGIVRGIAYNHSVMPKDIQETVNKAKAAAGAGKPWIAVGHGHVTPNPISSSSILLTGHSGFCKPGSIMLVSSVPVARIFTTWATGGGTNYEREFILLGGKNDDHTYIATDPYFSQSQLDEVCQDILSGSDPLHHPYVTKLLK